MGPSLAYIHHKNFVHNISLIRNAVGNSNIMAVVKANAYGHGSIELSKTAIKAGCEYLGVAFVEEGIELRKVGIKTPMLVFGAQLTEHLLQAVEYNLEVTVTSIDQLTSFEGMLNKNASVHIKVDTGMHRVGFQPDDFEAAVEFILDSSVLELKGIYTHFSTSDDIDDTYARLQMQRFEEIKTISKTYLQHDVLFHMANSAAIMKFPEAYFDMVRPGVMLYGGRPNPDFPLEWELKQVMELRSKIGLIQSLNAKEPVSYSRRYYTKGSTDVAVIPIGYADGYNRALTNKGEVIIKNKKYPVVGTVCMDMIMADLNKDSGCIVGDDVILWGENGDNKISIDNIAQKTGTIAYEVTCNISKRIPRIHLY